MGVAFVVDFYYFFRHTVTEGYPKYQNPQSPSYVCKSELIPKYGCYPICPIVQNRFHTI